MAVRDDFAAGEVLAAADLNDTFASKVDYALPVNAQTGTTYTFVAADAEKLTTASNGSAVTLTIPPASSVAWPDNTVLRVVNYGAGAVTIDGGSGVTVTNTSSTIAQYGAAVAIRTGSDAWTVVPFGGGDVPAAEVSSPAATGQYTDGGGQTWDYYTFTSSGTLTVDTAGFADVLVVGGGGSGGAGSGGGGGAGGHLYITDAYLPTGSLTVTVGAGGVCQTSIGGGSFGNNGNASRLGNFFAPGGGGGAAENFPSNSTNRYSKTGLNGGSGGGAGGYTISTSSAGGAGTSGLGNNGGSSADRAGGGGGGGSAVGANAANNVGGAGGAGTANSITGSSVTRAGGGGGSGNGTGGAGGTGGGGTGDNGTSGMTAGGANTGGGGGGDYDSTNGAAGASGGSGVVIVRVRTN